MVRRKLLLGVFLFGGAYYFWKRPSKMEYLVKSKAPVDPEKSGLVLVSIPEDELPIFSDRLAFIGLVTVLYFRDPNCPGVSILDRNLIDFLKYRPDVAVRQIALEPSRNGYLKAIRGYRLNIWTSPFIVIFDKAGKVLASDNKLVSDGAELLDAWIYKTLNEVQRP